MKKALTITNFLTASAAVVIITAAVLFGSRPDKKTKRFLGESSAIELFKNSNTHKNTENAKTISPLVKQAQSFAEYLNPPRAIRPKIQRKVPGMPVIPRPRKVNVKFDLIGTSYFQDRPESSLALFNEPGKGLTWVRQSASIGHLVIEQVKDGSVIAKDGNRTIELFPRRKPHRSLLRNKKSVPKASSSVIKPDILKSALSNSMPIEQLPQGDAELSEADIAEKEIAIKEMALIAQQMKKMEQLAMTDEPNMQQSDDLINKFMEQLMALRVTDEEANGLNDLGKKLNNAGSTAQSDKDKKIQKRKEILRKRTADSRKAKRRKGRKVQ